MHEINNFLKTYTSLKNKNIAFAFVSLIGFTISILLILLIKKIFFKKNSSLENEKNPELNNQNESTMTEQTSQAPSNPNPNLQPTILFSSNNIPPPPPPPLSLFSAPITNSTAPNPQKSTKQNNVKSDSGIGNKAESFNPSQILQAKLKPTGIKLTEKTSQAPFDTISKAQPITTPSSSKNINHTNPNPGQNNKKSTNDFALNKIKSMGAFMSGENDDWSNESDGYDSDDNLSNKIKTNQSKDLNQKKPTPQNQINHQIKLTNNQINGQTSQAPSNPNPNLQPTILFSSNNIPPPPPPPLSLFSAPITNSTAPNPQKSTKQSNLEVTKAPLIQSNKALLEEIQKGNFNLKKPTESNNSKKQGAQKNIINNKTHATSIQNSLNEILAKNPGLQKKQGNNFIIKEVDEFDKEFYSAQKGKIS